jgi:hypothetical protein
MCQNVIHSETKAANYNEITKSTFRVTMTKSDDREVPHNKKPYDVKQSKDLKEGEVIWESDRRGTLKTKYGSKTVFSHEYGLENCCYEAAQTLANDPDELKKENPECKLRTGMGAALDTMYPFLTIQQQKSIQDQIKELGGKLKAAFLEDVKLDDTKSDIDFLLVLGLKRDWKSGCAICLTDKIMGTTCTCGHTEITIFKPCGHSACTNPCMREVMKTHDIQVKPKTINIGGKEMIIGNSTCVNDLNGIPCHMCRTNITGAFQAQETFISNGIAKKICDDFATTLIV